MAEPTAEDPTIADVPAITEEEREAQFAREAYLWLDERFGDRDQKDVLTLELATKTVVG